jgi:hypothetical protein
MVKVQMRHENIYIVFVKTKLLMSTSKEWVSPINGKQQRISPDCLFPFRYQLKSICCQIFNKHASCCYIDEVI